MDISLFFEKARDFFLFWKIAGVVKIFRFFWFFFVFEFVRYIVFDFIAISFYKLKAFFLKGKYERAKEELFRQNPLVSIIVPGKNEGKHILPLVKSLQEQTYKNLEIIIIDDGSDDDTPQICRTLLHKGGIHKYLRNEVRGGKASAANFGMNEARGNFIVHIDADSSFDRDAIECIIIPFFLDSKIGAIAGNLKARNYSENLCTELQAIEYLKTIAVGRITLSAIKILRTVSGAFGAFRREVIERFGGWDVGPGLDGDISVKIKKLGYNVYMEPKAVCFTTVPTTFKALIKQRLRWNRSLIRFRLRKHKDVFLPTQNFRFSTCIGFVENLLSNVILDVKWLVYMLDISFHFPAVAKYIIPLNYLLYTMSNIIQFLMAFWISERKSEEFKMVPYLLLMPLYLGIYMRAVRTYAYIQEIFGKTSYQDPWNPRKVSRKAEELGI